MNFTLTPITQPMHFRSLISSLMLVFTFNIVASTESEQAATKIKIAAWNVEHLNAENGVGCIPRKDDDYQYIADRIVDLDADIVAFQEVESEAAAYRVFPSDQWRVIFSTRPNTTGDEGPICWGLEDKRLRHIATGFALRHHISFENNEDFADLAVGSQNQRWGADITVQHGDLNVRLLSVHLASGCWGNEQDNDSERQDICTTLDGQIDQLVEWIKRRNTMKESYIILGDFNRRLALQGDWAASRLFAKNLQTTLVTKNLRDGVEKKDWCDERYADLIDHIIASSSLNERIDIKSLKEHPRVRPSPDHCIISVDLVTTPNS